MANIYETVVQHRRSGRAAVLVTVVKASGHVPVPPPAKMLVGTEGLLAGTIGGGALEAMALDEAPVVLSDGESRLVEYLLDEARPGETATATGMLCGGKVTLFFEVLAPVRRAYLFGAGHVGRALAPLLTPLDFEVQLVDCRSETSPHVLADADYAGWPPLAGLDDGFVVVATHSHGCDTRVVEGLLTSGERPRYMGVLASRRKWATMTERLRTALGDDLDLSWIHSPAGLRLGGRSPAAIALSIAAEIQTVLTGTGNHDHMRSPSPRPTGEDQR